MPKLLHILTKPKDALAEKIIATQRANSENQIEVVDLTEVEPDYKKLAEKIFDVDSVQVW